MICVVVETPFARSEGWGAYLKACLEDCFNRDEAPFASHAIYPTVLDDKIERERELGMQMRNAWASRADKIIFYVDRGMSPGMLLALDHAQEMGQAVEFRTLEGDSFYADYLQEMDVALRKSRKIPMPETAK